MRHRRLAQRRQVDPLQRADARRRPRPPTIRSAPSSPMSARWRTRRAARQACRARQVGQDHPDAADLRRHRGAGARRVQGRRPRQQVPRNIREVDAIAHVLRCFEDDDITHVEGRIDPLADAETVETELMLADLESLEKRIDRSRKRPRAATRKQGAARPIRERWRRCATASPPAPAAVTAEERPIFAGCSC